MHPIDLFGVLFALTALFCLGGGTWIVLWGIELWHAKYGDVEGCEDGT